MTLSRAGWALCAAATVYASSTAAQAADAGRSVFRARCATCHSAEPGDGGGGQGPSLNGVVGRQAGRAIDFSYTKALRDSQLTWDMPTLLRFLADPVGMVPGTAMVVAVSEPQERLALVHYLAAVPRAAPSAVKAPRVADSSVVAHDAAPGVARGQEAANWHLDAPGRMHRVTVATLPAPYATESSSNRSSVVAPPENAQLAVPAGFHVSTYATELQGPRKMLLAPNGDVFVTETYGGRVSVMHPSGDPTRSAGTDIYAQNLKQPFGLAFYPNAEQPRWLYVAETNRVVRFPFQLGDVRARGEPQVVIAHLPAGAGHFTRDIAFSADGQRLFVSVGSASNVAESMPKKNARELAVWQAQHAPGAAWDQETDRAAVLVFDVAAPGPARSFATGIRNCVSLTLQPKTGAMWCTTNERDGLGDNLVPDYSTRLTPGGFYGWPWYYLGAHEDPRLKGERPDLAGKVLVPDVLYQSHAAPLNLTFYKASDGPAAFPSEYADQAFVAFHGSWNRSARVGYKLVRVFLKDGEPTGGYQDFLTGFIVDDERVWGRPVATVELADGSLLLSEDGNNMIYRIAYRRP